MFFVYSKSGQMEWDFADSVIANVFTITNSRLAAGKTTKLYRKRMKMKPVPSS